MLEVLSLKTPHNLDKAKTMEFLIILLLILLNGVFSMSEVALISARRPRLDAEAQKGDEKA